MKRKEAQRLLDEIGQYVTSLSTDCQINGKDLDLSQLKAGLATGIAYAQRILDADVEYPDSIKDESAILFLNGLDAYLRFFKKEDEKCNLK